MKQDTKTIEEFREKFGVSGIVGLGLLFDELPKVEEIESFWLGKLSLKEKEYQGYLKCQIDREKEIEKEVVARMRERVKIRLETFLWDLELVDDKSKNNVMENRKKLNQAILTLLKK